MTSPLRRLPIRLRLALWYALLLVATVAGIGVFLLATLESGFLQDVDEGLRLRARHVQRVIVDGWDGRLDPDSAAAALSDLAPAEEFAAPGIYAQVLDREGAILASSANLPGGQLPTNPDLIAAAAAGREVFVSVSVGEDRMRMLARPILTDGEVAGVVLVGKSLHLMEAMVHRAQRILGVVGVSAVLASILGGWWLTAHALGPIAQVIRVARRIASTGQFEQRIAIPPARDELSELVSTFNEMLTRLETTFRRQQEFLADASHELRGPLTVIRGNLDLLKLDLPPAERGEGVREAVEEVERMSRLISDLLFLAEADAQEAVLHQPVDLHEVLSDVWKRAVRLDAGSHEVVLVRNEPVTVQGDRDRLGQMLWNLVENALRYTPAGGRVTLSLSRLGQIAELAVADNGVGIPPEHLPHIFERFYRVDRARSRRQGSTGLGLAIVKQVAEAHGGQVRVRSLPGEGTIFTVALPMPIVT